MTPEQVIASLTNVTKSIDMELAELALSTALDMKERIQDRVQEEGKKSDGSELSPYSQNPLPLYFYEKQATPVQMERLKKNKRYKEEGLSYFGFRQETGKQTGHKDLTYTGRMWSETGVKQTTNQNGKVTVSVGGLTPQSQEKHEWMTSQQGVYLQPTEKEIAEQTTILNNGIEKIVTKYLGAV